MRRRTQTGERPRPHLTLPTRAADGARATARRTRVTLIIGGGIAAYKALDLIRRLKDRHMHVRCVLTRAAQQFVTPLAASALADERCYTDLFDPQSEFDAGHIRLARDCDLIVVAPATADLMAKMANGHADDLATAILLATDRPILLAPAMNPLMWSNAATRRNVAHAGRARRACWSARIPARWRKQAKPASAACRSRWRSRRPPSSCCEPKNDGPLRNTRLLVTAGPTHEPIDPVRYIANRSSGKQGFAIAAAAAAAGAEVKLISGPGRSSRSGRRRRHRAWNRARDMLAQVQAALPADCAIFAAAVADWRVADAGAQKIKKQAGAITVADAGGKSRSAGDGRATDRPAPAPRRRLRRRDRKPDRQRAIETRSARDATGSSPTTCRRQSGVMGGDRNTVHIVTRDGVESWPAMDKDDVATALVARIAAALTDTQP